MMKLRMRGRLARPSMGDKRRARGRARKAAGKRQEKMSFGED